MYFMKNTTLAFDKFLLEKARKLADGFGMSFNAWVNRIVSEAVEESQVKTVEDIFEFSKLAKGNSKGQTWTRDSMYER
jgi:hypothetical protein